MAPGGQVSNHFTTLEQSHLTLQRYDSVST